MAKDPSSHGRTDVKAMHRDMQSGGGKRLEGEYVLTEAKHILRILPPKKNGPFYYKYCLHYLPSREWVVCPKHTWNERCPI